MKMHLAALLMMIATYSIPTVVFYTFLHTRFRKNRTFNIIYWGVPIVFTFIFLGLKFGANSFFENDIYQILTWIMIAFVIIYVPFFIYVTFFLIDKLLKHLFKRPNYLRYILGIPLAAIAFVLPVYGVFNRYNVEVRRVELQSENLPKAFDGFKIAAISDTHLGNLTGASKYLLRVKDSINNEKPDVIFHLGDLVNNLALEGNGYEYFFNQLEAKVGKYAVMGNHDYGDYYPFETEIGHESNIARVKTLYEHFGFLLLNDDVVLLEKDSLNVIGIVGVENWGKPPFKQYGSLDKALTNHSLPPFNILLSHDPTLWDAKVKEHPNLILTLSGHTHAAQVGIETKRWQFSPAQWIFKEWSGLYHDNGQYLFVNRGLGYVGIPARIGMRPEVTIITLRSTK